MSDTPMPDTPLTGEEVGIVYAPQEATPQQDGADTGQAEPQFKFELATGQRYRDEQELVKAQEHATRHIYELNQQIAALSEALQAQRQPAEPPPDPHQSAIQRVAESLYNEGGIAWDAAVALAKIQVQQVAPVHEALNNLTRQQMSSEYEVIRSQDPAFDWNTQNQQHREVLETILTAFPNEGPRQHYSRFLKLTGRDPSRDAQVRQTVQTQIAQHRKTLGQPVDGPAPSASPDPPNVQRAVDYYIRLETSGGRNRESITTEELDRVRTRARSMQTA